MTRSRVDADYSRTECGIYEISAELNNTVSIAFQPIVNCIEQRIVGYEALVRGSNNESAETVIAKVTKKNRYTFDQLCRHRALENASRLGLDLMLSINFLPNALINPRRCVQSTLDVAQHYNFPPHNIIFEFTEVEKMRDAAHVANIIKTYKALGFKTAIDDFGAGHSNFERVWNLKPDLVKLDRTLLVRALSSDKTKSLLNSLVDLLHQAGCLVVIEGVEDEEQALIAMDSGADFIQGYYFARPQEKPLEPLEKSDIFKQLANKYINQQKEVNQKHADSVENYCRKFRESVLNLQQGLNFITACQPLAELNKSIRCFLTDELGNQITNTLLFKDNSLSNGKFKQLKLSENANWFRKHYIRHAIEHPSRMYISRPYRSITGDGLCSTISVAFKILGKTHVLCFDMEPHS